MKYKDDDCQNKQYPKKQECVNRRWYTLCKLKNEYKNYAIFKRKIAAQQLQRQ